MSSYLIEIPHDSDRFQCEKAAMVFLSSGSHFLSHAQWGCADGDHKAWLIVDVENKTEALWIVPPLYRSRAKIIQLTEYNLREMKTGMEKYNAAKV